MRRASTTAAALMILAGCGSPGVEGESDASQTATSDDGGSQDATSTMDASATAPATDDGSTSSPHSESSGSSGATGTEGGGGLADCGFDAALPFDPDGTILQLASADQGVCVWLERRNDGAGTMANTSWTLLAIRVGPLGAVAEVDDETQLCWYSSHHNFLDWAHVWTGDRHYDLKLREDGHGGARTYELSTFAQGPVDPDACAPLANGTEPIGAAIELFGVMP